MSRRGEDEMDVDMDAGPGPGRGNAAWGTQSGIAVFQPELGLGELRMEPGIGGSRPELANPSGRTGTARGITTMGTVDHAEECDEDDRRMWTWTKSCTKRLRLAADDTPEMIVDEPLVKAIGEPRRAAMVARIEVARQDLLVLRETEAQRTRLRPSGRGGRARAGNVSARVATRRGHLRKGEAASVEAMQELMRNATERDFTPAQVKRVKVKHVRRGRKGQIDPKPETDSERAESEVLAHWEAKYMEEAQDRVDHSTKWHPKGGTKLNGDQWEACGTQGWLLEAIRGRYGVRWKPGESEETVPAYRRGGKLYGNYGSCAVGPEDMAKVAKDLEQDVRDNISEWYDPELHGTEEEFAWVVSPMALQRKLAGDLRKLSDCTKSGVNGLQCEWPFSLTDVESILRELCPGWKLACRDMERGFLQVVCAEKLQRLLGFRSPVDGRLGRSRCYTMWLKGSPAVFCAITEEFGRILHAELERLGIRRWLTAEEAGSADGKGRWSVTVFVYVDDFPMAAVDDETMEATFGVMDEVAERLGISFKKSKDIGRPDYARGVTGLTEIVALGAGFSTANEECKMTLPSERAERYLTNLEEMLAGHEGAEELPLATLDSLAGRLSWTARLCRWGRAFLGETYAALAGTGHILRPDRKRKKGASIGRVLGGGHTVLAAVLAYGGGRQVAGRVPVAADGG